MNNIKGLPPFKRLCVTIGNLPSSYVDSMSYYECLMWLCKYLKDTVIPAVNENAEAVNELINWFNNLDVQDEVDHKLDEMAESGELTELIASYLETNALIGFDTVADLKDSENLVNGSYARTLGFNSINDGGSATYKIRTITNEDIVNEMDIIALNNSETLIAELISDQDNIMCYGVTTDDSNSNNHTIINYVINKRSKTYSNLDFTLSNSIEINDINKEFIFTNITYTGDSVAIIINNHDIKINGNTITSNHDGIKLGNTNVVLNVMVNINRINAENNSVVLGGNAGVLNSSLYIEQVNYKNHGIYFDLANSYVGQITVYGTNFTDNSSLSDNYAIYMDTSSNKCTGLTMYNISLEGSKGGIYVSSTTNKYLEHLKVYGCRTAEMSRSQNKKVIKLISGNISNMIEGNFDFDYALTDSFDLSEYHAYSQNGLIFNGALMRTGSDDLVGTKAVASYGGIVITEYSRDIYLTSGNNQVIKTMYDYISVGNGTGTYIKLNTMPKVNELFTKPLRIYINSTTTTKLYIVAGDSDTTRYEENCGQYDIFEFYPSYYYHQYGYTGYIKHYKKSDNSVSWSVVSANF